MVTSSVESSRTNKNILVCWILMLVLSNLFVRISVQVHVGIAELLEQVEKVILVHKSRGVLSTGASQALDQGVLS